MGRAWLENNGMVILRRRDESDKWEEEIKKDSSDIQEYVGKSL